MYVCVYSLYSHTHTTLANTMTVYVYRWNWRAREDHAVGWNSTCACNLIIPARANPYVCVYIYIYAPLLTPQPPCPQL